MPFPAAWSFLIRWACPAAIALILAAAARALLF